MTITATRIGSSPLRLDWTDLQAQPMHGAHSANLIATFTQAQNALKERFQKGEIGFYDAPINPELSDLEACKTLAQEVLNQGFTDVLSLGIGGSSLGPIVLDSALIEKKKSPLRFHFLENPDPTDWKTTLGQLNPSTTLVLAITKSGSTFETLAQLLIAMEWLGQERLSRNLILITDPKSGDLRKFATENKLRTLAIAPSIGGRFSVFSPVGLFPALLMGLDIDAFLLGAKQVRDYLEKTPIEKNPFLTLGHTLIQHYPRRSEHVFLPYSTRLKILGSWFVQLWAESLGKNTKGFTPLAACGPLDQHSLLQLLKDGPDNKITWFVTLDDMQSPAQDVKIPKLAQHAKVGAPQYPAFQILENHSLGELMTVEQQSISKVLTRAGKPHFSLQLDRLDERALGSMLFALSYLTAITGTLWGVNPFDQPGVEEGKVYIRETLQFNRKTAMDSEIADENSPVARLRREPSSNSFSED